MSDREAVRLLKAHGVLRRHWAGNKKPPTPEALLRSFMMEQALQNTGEGSRKLLEILYFGEKSFQSICMSLSVSRATLYRMRHLALADFIRAYLQLQ